MERSFVCNYDDGTTEEYRLTGKEIAVMHFEGEVDITDPCYAKDVWCRLKVALDAADYHCVAWEFEEGEWNTRVGIISLVRADAKDDFFKESDCFEIEELGEIGVDAGLAGFFMNKPDYSETEWLSFCERFFGTRENPKDGNAWVYEHGFFSSTGYGDGMYPVFAYKDGATVKALEILFL